MDLEEFDDLKIQKSSIKSSIKKNNEKAIEAAAKKAYGELCQKINDDKIIEYIGFEDLSVPCEIRNLLTCESISNVHIYAVEKRPSWWKDFTDTLGCYIPCYVAPYVRYKYKGVDYKKSKGHPVILLYGDMICKKMVELYPMDPKNIGRFVLLHELAHAMLDESNLIQKMKQKPIFDYDNEDGDFRQYMEESLANYIMLQYVKEATPGEYNACKKFVNGQSDAYKLALKYKRKKIDWSFWRLKKQEIYNQLSDENSPASVWYNLAQDQNSSPADVCNALRALIKSFRLSRPQSVR